MIEGWLRRKRCQGKSTEVRRLPLPGKGTGIQPNPAFINSWSGSAHALSSPITWTLEMENLSIRSLLETCFSSSRSHSPLWCWWQLWEGMSPSAVQIPGGSSGLHWAGGSWWAKLVPVSLTPTFSKYFCLWSDPGNWNCSSPEADLADKFLTFLCNSEMKNANKLFSAFTEESEFPLQSWLNFPAI